MKPEAPIPIFDSTSGEASDRVFLIDKPSGISSFDVIRSLRRITGIRKIGHAGTLDPIATGLLICMTGSTTRLSRHFMEMTKVYSGTMKFGEETASYDSETEVVKRSDCSFLTEEMIAGAAREMEGDIIQLTPIYAAVKVGGEPLYKYAREGRKVTRPPRVVSVYSFETGPLHGQSASFKVSCSTGTYVRTLVHDLGQAVKTGAHLTSLRRDAIGPYSVADAIPLHQLQEMELRL